MKTQNILFMICLSAATSTVRAQGFEHPPSFVHDEGESEGEEQPQNEFLQQFSLNVNNATRASASMYIYP